MKKLIFLILSIMLIASTASAATYYVSPTGSNSNTGLSDAQAWRDATNIGSTSFSTGDDIYFKCGGTWTGSSAGLPFEVRMGGTSSNRVVIGAYYMSGGSPVIGVYGNKPKFDGVKSGNAGTVPTRGSWAAMIQVTGHPYVTVQDLEIVWSGDRGIAFNSSTNGLVSNCTVTSSYGAGILFESGSNYGTAQFNTISDCGRSELFGLDWPAVICAYGNVTNFTAKYNFLYNNYGEGIGLYETVSDGIVEYNVIINSIAPNIYFAGNAKRNIARYNLIYGYSGAPFETEGGIVVDDEGQFGSSGTEGSKIYGNLIANTACGVGLQTWSDQALVKDTEVYNNTLIDNTIAFRSWSRSGPFQNSFVKNNIVWITGTRGGCSFTDIPSATGITFDYNLWSSQPSPSFLRGAHDPGYAAPGLTKTTGWNSITLGSLRGPEFGLTAGSAAIGVGATLASPYNTLLDLPQYRFYGRGLSDGCSGRLLLSRDRGRSLRSGRPIRLPGYLLQRHRRLYHLPGGLPAASDRKLYRSRPRPG